ncbi:MAG: 1-deoxy-D-xylulose-5-phosphate reductoisomerase [Oscillospiraceae bacterium]|jgi:1-deoxy-D-xylulose-5-phosphate reductoisomerase|nr:1-deoxy-D-xylulose-5-phosphate reductoisomerase [Oscillospiraceae bacterium]
MNISLLGSTGSIGTQALEVMSALGLRPKVLAARRSVKSIEEQARRYRPKLVCLEDTGAARSLKTALADTDIRVVGGREGVIEAASFPAADAVLNAMVGMAGLEPALAAVKSRKTLLLANKEALVCGGAILTAAARDTDVPIIPVDSEHSAIFQCLQAGKQGIRKLILTASGGPFRGWNRERLAGVTPEMALKHPNWNMGPKVTIDSALLLNKGLELIEAMWLFGMPPERISVVIHPQSVIHSLVEYEDGAMLAQLGAPDMRVPIQYAITYPSRKPCPGSRLDLVKAGTLTFEAPDMTAFPSLPLAYSAAERGGNAGAVFNAAAETAVGAFLDGKCGFNRIPERIEYALSRYTHIDNPTLQDILETDRFVRGMKGD